MFVFVVSLCRICSLQSVEHGCCAMSTVSSHVLSVIQIPVVF